MTRSDKSTEGLNGREVFVFWNIWGWGYNLNSKVGTVIRERRRGVLEQTQTSLPFAASLNNKSCYTVCRPHSLCLPKVEIL